MNFRQIFLGLIPALFMAGNSSAAEYGSMTDERDGKTYRTVQFDDMVWMAENLNTKRVKGYCYNGKRDNCNKFGRLYKQAAAKNACPNGWHLPNKAEWAALLEETRGSVAELKSASWKSKSADVEPNGFDALPGGSRDASTLDFNGMGSTTFFSSSTDYVMFFVGLDTAVIAGGMSENNYVYVRCVEGETPTREEDHSHYTDSRDGRSYKVVRIGGQTWFAENLAYQADESSCFSDEDKCNRYGRFYSLNASRNACPSGTHLPSEREWRTLFSTIGGFENGDQLISDYEADRGYDYRDPYGFSVLFAGRVKYGDHDYMGSAAHFWNSDGDYVSFDKGSSYVEIRGTYGDSRRNSIRCIVEE